MKPHLVSCHVHAHRAEIALALSPDMLWFQGHFDEYPILPGVAQLDWVMHFIQHTSLAHGVFTGFQQLKFTLPIQPHDAIKLVLQVQENDVLFTYSVMRQNEERVASSGRVKLCP